MRSEGLPTPLASFIYFSLSLSLRKKDYEEQIQKLSQQLEEVRGRLQAAEKQSTQPSPLLLQLREDLKRVKVGGVVFLVN